MALTKSEARDVFDLSQIHRGDCVRIQRRGDATARNGIVADASGERLSVLCCNGQGGSFGYSDVAADEAARGEWDIRWTSDFEAVLRQEGAW